MELRVNHNANISRTGVRGLDEVLNGGLTKNRLYLVDGDPGAGKTTLALQYLLEGVKAGEKCLYVTLSETREELTTVAESHGWSLDGIEIVEIIAGENELTNETQLTMYHPSEIQLSDTTRQILEAVQRVNPMRVIFDSLSEIRLLAQDSMGYRRQVLALKQFFLGRRCTVLMLDDRATRSPDTQLQSIAHGVIALEQLAPEYGAERRRLRIIKLRGTQYRGGYHDFRILRGGLQIFPRLVAAEHYKTFDQAQLKSGVHELDTLLGGGVDRGTNSLLLGPAGTGKSTIAFQYAVSAASRGEHAVVFAFDEGIATLRARANAVGMNFKEGIGPHHIRIHSIDPAEVSPGEFAFSVREAVEDHGATVIVIDSLNGYLSAMPEERFLVIQMHELLSYLGRQGVTTFMVVAQHGLVDAMSQAPLDTSYLADTVVLFRYFEHQARVRKAISVVKKRSGYHEETIRELSIGGKGIQLSQPLRSFTGILSNEPSPSLNDGIGV